MTSRIPSLFSAGTLSGANASRSLRSNALQRSWQCRPVQSPAATARRTFTSESESGTKRSRYDVTGTTLVLTLIPIVTFVLGTWQVKRLQWKLNLIKELDEKLSKEPLHLPNMIDTSVIPEFEYRKVEVTGRFDHSKELLLGPRTRDGVLGYQVVTPLIREEGVPGSTILVNRGHVSVTKKDQASRPESLIQGRQDIIGMLRSQDKRNMFTPANKPETGEFQFADIDQMATTAHTQPVLVDQIFEGHAGEMKQMMNHGIPIGRAPTIELRNTHATYAVTWYALSAATSVMLWRLFKKPPSRTSKFSRFEN